jgi:hypothetical protein
MNGGHLCMDNKHGREPDLAARIETSGPGHTSFCTKPEHQPHIFSYRGTSCRKDLRMRRLRRTSRTPHGGLIIAPSPACMGLCIDLDEHGSRFFGDTFDLKH